jgi:hypothetical protein
VVDERADTLEFALVRITEYSVEKAHGCFISLGATIGAR